MTIREIMNRARQAWERTDQQLTLPLDEPERQWATEEEYQQEFWRSVEAGEYVPWP